MSTYNDSCIFCKIIQKQINPSTIILENEHVLVIPDINPKAPIHYLIIPKTHVLDLRHLAEKDNQFALAMINAMTELAHNLPDPKAFNIICNNGAQAGQSVMHLHWHFLAGKNIYQGGFSL